jgi:GDP-4-dehydro-6-deoxy-D-mannose reductase
MGGFAGSHLAEHLLAEGWQVCGTILEGEEEELPERLALSCEIIPCDIVEHGALERAVSKARPEVIFHLAARSSVSASWESPEATFQVNVMGSLALLEAIGKKAPGARVVFISSGEVYGESFSSGPALEDTPLRPLTPYAASKACADWIAGGLAPQYGIDVRRVRPFNHTGPRQKPFFVASSLARQIAFIEAGSNEPLLRVGNLEARRDFTDVRDMTRGYKLIGTKGEPGAVYNACSGKVISMGELLESLLVRTSVPIEIEKDPKLLRSADIPEMAGDATRLREVTGWEPAISWDQTLDDLLNYWRDIASRGTGP